MNEDEDYDYDDDDYDNDDYDDEDYDDEDYDDDEDDDDYDDRGSKLRQRPSFGKFRTGPYGKKTKPVRQVTGFIPRWQQQVRKQFRTGPYRRKAEPVRKVIRFVPGQQQLGFTKLFRKQQVRRFQKRLCSYVQIKKNTDSPHGR
ncbi:MAG: hypothetical protein KL787_05755 [Taibaiella sp.]|nr:hypothetical protein [Taibaiella sp.]